MFTARRCKLLPVRVPTEGKQQAFHDFRSPWTVFLFSNVIVLARCELNLVTLLRAAGTGQAGQAKAGPLFLDSPLYGIDRPIIVLGNDRQASIFVC